MKLYPSILGSIWPFKKLSSSNVNLYGYFVYTSLRYNWALQQSLQKSYVQVIGTSYSGTNKKNLGIKKMEWILIFYQDKIWNPKLLWVLVEKHLTVEAHVFLPLLGLYNSFSSLLLATLGVFCSLSLSMTTKLLPEDLSCVTGLPLPLRERKKKIHSLSSF